MNLRQTAQALASREVTARQLISDALEQAARSADTFISINDDMLENAVRIDRARAGHTALPPLAGVPITLKDLFDVQGQMTLAGSIALAHAAQPAKKDAAVIAPLRRAGLQFLGRVNMSEFAFSGMGMNIHYGTPLSIWDRDCGRLPGGSSSGSAVSIAEGIVTISMGSDTAGSCRIPAAFNGVVGVKPSFGRLSLAGVFPLSPTSDTPGPLAVDVDSCFIVDQLIGGQWSGTGAIPGPDPIQLQDLRMIVPQCAVLSDLDAPVAKSFEDALDALKEAGATIEMADFDVLNRCIDMFANRALAGYEALLEHRALLERYGHEYDPFIYRRMLGFRAITDAQQQARYREKAQLKSDFVETMDALNIQALLYPTVACVPPRLEEAQVEENMAKVNLRCLRNTATANYFDGCAMSLPCHRLGEAPVGLMLSMRHGADAALYSAGIAIESALSAMR